MSKKKPAKAVPYKRIAKINPIAVLFGLDEQEQPRGAQFSNRDDALLARMAKGLGLRIGVAHAAHQIAIASQLPKGDMHATGTKAVPTITLELYEKLNALVGGETGVITTSQPTSWDGIEPGHLVIAQDTLADGWWPAVVVKRHQKNLVMKWRDYPGLGEFIREASSVALLSQEQS
jgi:hypothetical protein